MHFGSNWLVIGAVSLEEDNLVVFYYLNATKRWPDKRIDFGSSWLVRGAVSLEEGNLVVIYYLSATEISSAKGSYKRRILWWE